MKQFIIYAISFCCLLFWSGSALSQIDTPQPSPLGTITQVVGLTEVSINYSRPGVKDRVAFGEVVEYETIWRTGANASTKISFSDDVVLAGNKVKAGEYAIYTVPGKDEWSVMLYSDLTLGGNVTGYDQTKEVLKFTVKPENLASSVETLTFDIGYIRNNEATISVSWDKTKISFKMEVDYDSKVTAQIDKKMENPLSEAYRIYATSARYYFDEKKDLQLALDWMNKALEINPEAFWNIHLKAQIQAEMEDYPSAIKTAEESMAKASTFEDGDFGYIKRNEEAIAKWKTMQ